MAPCGGRRADTRTLRPTIAHENTDRLTSPFSSLYAALTALQEAVILVITCVAELRHGVWGLAQGKPQSSCLPLPFPTSSDGLAGQLGGHRDQGQIRYLWRPGLCQRRVEQTLEPGSERLSLPKAGLSSKMIETGQSDARRARPKQVTRPNRADLIVEFGDAH